MIGIRYRKDADCGYAYESDARITPATFGIIPNRQSLTGRTAVNRHQEGTRSHTVHQVTAVHCLEYH